MIPGARPDWPGHVFTEINSARPELSGEPEENYSY